jgi:hypothetical protein
MNNFKFKLHGHGRGMMELMKREETMAACKDEAEKIRERCGEGYEIGERHYPDRNGAAVYPADEDAFYDNLANNTLEKALR